MLKKYGKVYVILIGNKARQGKDTVAQYMKKHLDNVHIIHFADPLKMEVMNKMREFPLIQQSPECYTLLDTYDNPEGYYPKFKFLDKAEVPYLNEIFNKRKIDVYWGMDGNGFDKHKDGEMLQFWGTDFRRKLCDENYWVNVIDQWIKKIRDNSENVLYNGKNVYICIPDTRFKNEYEYLKTLPSTSYIGVFAKVERFKNKTRFVASDRDPMHESEVNLDDVEPEYVIKNDKTLKNLEKETLKFIKYLHSI